MKSVEHGRTAATAGTHRRAGGASRLMAFLKGRKATATAPKPKTRTFGIGVAAICIFSLTGQYAHAADKEVTIGYVPIVDTYAAAIADHAFEKATGYKIHWQQFSSGGPVIKALASGAVQISTLGSSPIAAAVSHGIPIELFWILEGIGSNEELVIRNGSGIHSPKDLADKPIAVPAASTSALDLFFALKQWGVNARVLNMPPSAITAAWDRGDIDGAFVWDPALSHIKRTGKVMVSSGQLCKESGVCTFDGLVVDKDWAAKHPKFMTAFVKVLAKYYADYEKNPEAWTAGSPMVKGIAQFSGADPMEIPGILKNYEFPNLEQQASSAWLGGSAGKNLVTSASFLKEVGQLDSPLPAADYEAAVTTKWVEKALAK